VTNVDFGEWTDNLGDPPLVMALSDRVVDRSIIIKFDGKSYRAERAETMVRAARKRNLASGE
jgi:hypothetical protein